MAGIALPIAGAIAGAIGDSNLADIIKELEERVIALEESMGASSKGGSKSKGLAKAKTQPIPKQINQLQEAFDKGTQLAETITSVGGRIKGVE